MKSPPEGDYGVQKEGVQTATKTLTKTEQKTQPMSVDEAKDKVMERGS